MNTQEMLKQIEAKIASLSKTSPSIQSAAAAKNQQRAPEQPTEAAEDKVDATHSSVSQALALLQPIAIIGLSGYFPKSQSVQAFWQALDRDEALLEEIPKTRFDWEMYYDPSGEDMMKSHTKWGGFIPDIRSFDARFFQMLPRDTQRLDPRQRLLLMSVYHTLEDAGYAPESLRETRTGLFVGAEENEYVKLPQWDNMQSEGIGNAPSMIANQISYFFDWRGPSEYMNTMCSGGAVAIHRAVASLRCGESQQAVVGVSNLLLRPEMFIALSAMGQMSSAKSVNSFGRDANGYLPAEGVASIMLKPLVQAEADGDAIYAVLKNTAVNFNGQGGMSIASPNMAAHTDLILQCYREAGLDPCDLGYIEAQGMANPVTDIAEWRAFNRALQTLAEEKQVAIQDGSCKVSTLKPTLGHMHSASAFGALFRIIRSLQTNTIHKIRDFKQISPDLETDHQPCQLVTETQPWLPSARPRLAGLHSYGLGGNNAHLLIEEYRSQKPMASDPQETQVLPFSAQTLQQCHTLIANLLATVRQHPEYTLAAIAHTLQVGRDAMRVRVAFVTQSREAWMKLAQAYLDAQPESGVQDGVFAGVVDTAQIASGTRFIGSTADPRSVAQMWVQGQPVVWQTRDSSRRETRLHLPIYPFELKEYWLDEPRDPLLVPKPSPVNSQGMVADRLVNLFETTLLLSRNEIEAASTFKDLGISSINSVDLLKAINREFSLELPTSLIFEHNSFDSLTRYLETYLNDHQLQRLENLVEDDAQPKQFETSAAGRIAHNKIAVIGMACRCAGAENPNEFWELIHQGKDGIENIREQSWLDFFAAHPKTPVSMRYGRMQGREQFDAGFFGISQEEAACMDFPQRLLLEDTYQALEDAGIDPASLQKQLVGTFIGSAGGGAPSTDISPYSLFGVDTSILSSRIAYCLDLKGPAITLNTACSSSLVAMDMACQYLRSGRVDLAIVGGVTIYSDPQAFIMMHSAGMLSPTGTCRPFDNKADGMVVGDGSGVVILKRLEDAKRDHDSIYGAIAAISTNQNGQTAGLTVPSYLSQSELQVSLYRAHHINVEDIQYIEAHGTATKLGDPIEVDALNHSFQQFTAKKHYCAIGSVKANIGNTAAASGVLSVIKVLLGLKHQLLPRSLHFEQSNEHIDFENSPFYVNTSLREWPSHGRKPRLAAVTSLGHSGTNAHLVLEEYLPVQASPTPARPEAVLIPLSAKTPASLAAYARKLAGFLQQNATLDLNALAYTLQVGRESMKHRGIFLVKTLEELVGKLKWLENCDAQPGQHDWIENYWQGEAKQPHRPHSAHSLWSTPLATLAERWANGEHINWQLLYGEVKPQRLHLPTYAFAKTVSKNGAGEQQSMQEIGQADHLLTEEKVERFLKHILAQQVGCPAEHIHSDQNYFELGLDSLGVVNILKSLEHVIGKKVVSSILFEYRTVAQLSSYLRHDYADILAAVSLEDAYIPANRSRSGQAGAPFPELILLNENGQGRPVFWFHGGLGGVQPYHILAEVCERPFYGIQARGWAGEQPPLYGVQAMASYYIQAMQTVQATGPYDLGGYSLGGLIAYEVTRQLQDLGETVANIVMLDTLDTRDIQGVERSPKNDFLAAVNIALQTTGMQNPEAFSTTLIHRDQLDTSLSDEAFLQELIALAQARGLPYTEDQVYDIIRRQARVQAAHEAHRYEIGPLPNAHAVNCYYFRNKNGVYMGELKSYFVLAGDEYILDNKNNWEIWQAQFPHLSIFDVDASNHVVLLSEPKVYETLRDFCRVLYSRQGMTTEFFHTFQKEIIAKHGTLKWYDR